MRRSMRASPLIWRGRGLDADRELLTPHADPSRPRSLLVPRTRRRPSIPSDPITRRRSCLAAPTLLIAPRAAGLGPRRGRTHDTHRPASVWLGMTLQALTDCASWLCRQDLCCIEPCPITAYVTLPAQYTPPATLRPSWLFPREYDETKACPSRIRCQAATGSWTRSRQWETHRTLFSSARATVCPPAKVNGVWPSNDVWLRVAL